MSNEEEMFLQTMQYYEGLSRPMPQEDLVALLREVQEIYGSIPVNIQKKISDKLEIRQQVIKSIIKFYPSLKEAPYKYRITVCSGRSCSSKDADKVVNALKQTLKTGIGRVSRDHRFLLTVQPCLKKCGQGPNMVIEDDLYSAVQIEQIPDILKKYK